MPAERLQKILARAGVASRRRAEELIMAGRVTVDGRPVSALGAKADPAASEIRLDGRLLPKPGRQYWLLHKPAGVVSTLKDPQGRPKVSDLLPPEAGRVYPVGRLDFGSEGLMLLTNHGELAHRLMHPRFKVPKAYRVWVKGRPGPAVLARLRGGVALADGPSAPAQVGLKGGGAGTSKLSFIISEGRKRVIRRMCAAVGHPVVRLKRVGLGPLRLGNLPPGAARRLTPKEVEALLKAVGLAGGKGGKGRK